MSWDKANRQMIEIFSKEEPALKDIVALLKIQMQLLRQMEERIEELAEVFVQPLADEDFLAQREEALKEADIQADKFFQDLQKPRQESQ